MLCMLQRFFKLNGEFFVVSKGVLTRKERNGPLPLYLYYFTKPFAFSALCWLERSSFINLQGTLKISAVSVQNSRNGLQVT